MELWHCLFPNLRNRNRMYPETLASFSTQSLDVSGLTDREKTDQTSFLYPDFFFLPLVPCSRRDSFYSGAPWKLFEGTTQTAAFVALLSYRLDPSNTWMPVDHPSLKCIFCYDGETQNVGEVYSNSCCGGPLMNNHDPEFEVHFPELWRGWKISTECLDTFWNDLF